MLNTNTEHQKVMHDTNYTLVIGTDSHWMEMLSRASHVDGFLLYTGVQHAQTWSENPEMADGHYEQMSQGFW